MTAWAKRIYILIITVNTFFFFFSLPCFLKEIKTCSPCFSRVIKTLVKVWENSKKPWKHSPVACSKTFLILPNFHSCFCNSIETQDISYFLNVIANSRIYQQFQAGPDQSNINGLPLMPAAPVMQFLWLPKNVLPHYRINQICIKTLSNNQSQWNVSKVCRSTL